MILNETPIRTAENYNANNMEIKDVKISDKIELFLNRTIYVNGDKKVLLVAESIEDSNRLNDLYEDSKILVSELTNDDFKLKYGIWKDNDIVSKERANQPLRIVAKSDSASSDCDIEFCFDENNLNLIDNIEIYAEKNSKINLVISYIPKLLKEQLPNKENGIFDETTVSANEEKNEYFHNGIIKVCGLENSEINITIINLLNNCSNNFINVENKLLDNSILNYTIVDFGGKNSILNFYSNLFGKNSNNNINSIYLGTENNILDYNYIAQLQGEKSNVNIEVQGALKDSAIKHFKGTIDFKKGCKKAIGNENENCLLLSDKAKSLALPVLLCQEEEVVGNHSSSSGKCSKSELFYLMTRGFNEQEALKLLVKAKFNRIIDGINSKNARELVLDIIDMKL